MSGQFDLDIISKAPTSPSHSKDEGHNTSVEISVLRHENTALQDEVDGLRKEISVESQKARLLIPYANKVFVFCCFYTSIAFCVLFLSGYTSIPFQLETSTMNFIAGSNLASVIGLLAIIAGGLFSSK